MKSAAKNRKFEMFFYSFCCLSGQMLLYAVCNRKNAHNKKYTACHIAMSVLSWITCTGFLLVNAASLVFNMYVIGSCPYTNCTYFCTKYHKSHDVLDAYFIRSSMDNNDEDMNMDYYTEGLLGAGGIQPEPNFQYNNWNKLLITTGTISGFLSYYMMIFLVLVPIYSNMFCLDKNIAVPNSKSRLKHICTSWYSVFRKQNYDKILSPFLDNPDDEQSSELSIDQKYFFLIFYILNLTFFFASLIVFCKLIMLQRLKNVVEPDKDINETGLLCQFLSQFCAIQSCFIFSKVAYGVSNKCNKLIKKITENIDVSDSVIQYYLYHYPATDLPAHIYPQNRPPDKYEMLKQEIGNDILSTTVVRELNEKIFQSWPHAADRQLTDDAKVFTDQARFLILKKIDGKFNHECKASIAPYSHWFAVHWFLYSLTSFMAMAFLTESYIRYIYRHKPQETKWWHADKKEVYAFVYIALFCITHVFLFVYPCFRVAFLTSSRARAIRKVLNYEWLHLSPSLQAAFHNHMQAQGFGFKISVFCAEITFGFNLAFISVFIGMFGIIMKLSL